jgi:Putative Ig domain
VLWANYAGSSTQWPAAAAIGVGTGPALSITTTALPDATAGSAYTQTLNVSGGHAPYLWAAGPVPPGLVLHQNGTLSGTPASAGTWMISLSVVDDSAPTQLADASLQLIVH